jgi:hypothetical protein
MDVCGWTSVDGKGQMEKTRWIDGNRRQTLDITERTIIATNCPNGNVAERSASTSFIAMVCRKKKKKNLLLCGFFKIIIFFFLFFLELLQGLFTT